MRVGLDATPLLGARTGVGRYVEHLVAALAGRDGLDLVATAFTLRGAGGLPAAVPPGVTVRHRPAPARALQAAWRHAPLPPVEWLTGRLDVFHGTNFVLPPRRRAGGVVTVHDLSYLRFPETVTAASLRYRELVPRGLRRAAVVLTPSEAVAAEVRAEYGLGDRVLATPLGVDDAWFGAAPADPGWLAGRGLPERYLLFVGTVAPRKGLPALLRALRLLHDADPGTPPLVLVGPPGWGPALETAALPAGAVVAAGYLDTADLRRLVAGAAALVFPTVYEGFGLPPLEAFAAGTPVVASDLPVIREVTGPLAALAPAGDDAALAGALARVLAEPDTAAARAARQARARLFSWAGTARLTYGAYEIACAG
ncbi:MAG TPA: glycosyltransferase family 1 protein [Mycobacteriales bacterium]|nr:glycosyltransferase family 1 protein [Mycobacteriales bacterium]